MTQLNTLYNTPIKIGSYSIYLGFYLLLATLFFFFVAKEDIQQSTENIIGRNNLVLYADHPTYVGYFNDLRDDPFAFLLLRPNFIGPFVIQYLVGNDLTAIYIFNTICLCISVKIVVNNLPVNQQRYILFLLINPITFISLFSVNKEIITLVATTIFAVYLINKKKRILLVAIIIGVLARKELSILFLSQFIIFSLYKGWSKRVYLLSFLILVSLTAFGFIINELFVQIAEYSQEAETAVSNSDSGGTILLLNKVQDRYGYIWAFFPKLILNLIGDVLSRTGSLFQVQNVYTDVIVWGQSFLFLFLIPSGLSTLSTSQFLFHKKLLLSVITSCLMFSYIPVVQNRYFYSTYVLLIISITVKKSLWSTLKLE